MFVVGYIQCHWHIDSCGCLHTEPLMVLVVYLVFFSLFFHTGGKTWTLQNQTNLWVHLKTLTSSPVHCNWYSGTGRAPVSWPQNQTPLSAGGHHVIQGSNHEWTRVTAGRQRQRSWSSEPGKRQRRQRHPCGDWRWNRVSFDKQRQGSICWFRQHYSKSNAPQLQPAWRIWKLWEQLCGCAREWNRSTQNLQQL